MFKPGHMTKFVDKEEEAIIFVSQSFSIAGLEQIANMLTHFCVERKREQKAADDQRLKDEEANKKPELEAQVPEEIDELHQEEEDVKEEPVPTEE